MGFASARDIHPPRRSSRMAISFLCFADLVADGVMMPCNHRDHKASERGGVLYLWRTLFVILMMILLATIIIINAYDDRLHNDVFSRRRGLPNDAQETEHDSQTSPALIG
jgi:di/tricarboxylate transporter